MYVRIQIYTQQKEGALLASIKDVAKMAGVSVAAVSKYMKTPQNMREETRRKISHAIEVLNYRPNPLAQSLRTGKTNIIAIALPEVGNPYFSEIFKYLQHYSEKRGLLAVLLNNSTLEQTKSTISIIESGVVDGVIFYDNGQAGMMIQEAELNVPMVKVVPQTHAEYPATVGIDLTTGIKKLCAHLEQTGVHTIAYVGPDNNASSRQKMQAIMDCCESGSLRLVQELYLSDYNYNSGYACAADLVRSGVHLPDAIIVESDMSALGVLKGLTERGIQIPRDVRISGYDNTDISQMSTPSLTSVHIPLEEICTCALNMLCDIMNGKEVAPVYFETDLQIRASTMPPV